MYVFIYETFTPYDHADGKLSPMGNDEGIIIIIIIIIIMDLSSPLNWSQFLSIHEYELDFKL
jgi:hypothetical protein